MIDKRKAYNNESISALKGADRVRKRPAVIFGSDGLIGCQHSFFEILSNSIDEAREGFGDVIEVIKHADKSITVKDYGRGTPVDFNQKERKYNWKLVYCELYAGSKYNNNDESTYGFSLGLNGLGCCATQYASEFMDVEVIKDGYQYNLHFEQGVNKGGLSKEKTKNKQTGTITRWKPDLKVFTDIDIPLEYFQDVLKRQAVVNSGLKFTLLDEESNQSYEYLYEKGVAQYIEEIAGNQNFSPIVSFSKQTKGRDRADKEDYKVKMAVSFCFCNEVNLVEYYHNSSYLEHGGAPDKAVKQAFAFAIDKFLKDEGKYNKNESKVSYNDVFDSLILVSNSFSTVTSYANQTKKAITNKFIQSAMTDFLKRELEIYFIENKADALKIAEQVLVNKRSSETAEKTRINIKKKLGKKVDLNNRVKKFVDCRSKDLDKREVYIVEGDSALGSCKMGRDAEFQAIMPVRGKILNCLKADYNRIFKNEIILDLLKVLGCGVEIKSKHAKKSQNTFDIKKLNWEKVIICTDADYDGFQIRTLILTMFYRLVPKLIDEGKIYIAESPLFEITSGKDIFFAYDENEKKDIVAKLEKEKKKYTLQRSKGLGENEPEMMWQTTMNPETRRLIQVLPDSVIKMEEAFNLFEGDNLQGRKDYIQQNGHLYTDLLDIS